MRVTSGLVVPAAIALVLAGCGFNDQLTTRGFIERGDDLCASAVGKSYTAVQRARAGGANEQAIRALARGYSSISAGIRDLDVSDRDDGIRDAMVRQYGRAARRIDAAARSAAAGNPNAVGEALGVVNSLGPFMTQVRAYGFKVCGGRALPGEA